MGMAATIALMPLVRMRSRMVAAMHMRAMKVRRCGIMSLCRVCLGNTHDRAQQHEQIGKGGDPNSEVVDPDRPAPYML